MDAKKVKRILLMALIIISYSFAVLSIPYAGILQYSDAGGTFYFTDIVYYLYHPPLNFFLFLNIGVGTLAGIVLYLDCTGKTKADEKAAAEKAKKETKE